MEALRALQTSRDASEASEALYINLRELSENTGVARISLDDAPCR